MIGQEMAHQDLGLSEGRFASPAGSGWYSFAAWEEAQAAALRRAQEDAAVDAEDVLSQADEALVLG